MATLDSAPDGLLARRAADGDEHAFSVLVRRHAPYLRAFARRLGAFEGDADDAVQEALIAAWKRLPELSDPDHVRSWLTTIVSRKVVDRARSRKDAQPLHLAPEPVVLADGPEQAAVAGSQLEALGRVVRGLPDELRHVWVLREVSGASYEDIAERLGVTPSTVRGRLARARTTVIEQMQEWR
jgi:RNA polymerase sigma-70 factor, ECF subfamily